MTFCNCGNTLVSPEEFFSGRCQDCITVSVQNYMTLYSNASDFEFADTTASEELEPMAASANVPEAPQPTFEELIDKLTRKVMKSKHLMAKPAKKREDVTVVQESPYRIFDCRHNSPRKFIEWLRDVNDARFGVKIKGSGTIFFKTPRDVANFILGFNLREELDGANAWMQY